MERKRETIDVLGLPARVNNILKKHMGFIDVLVLRGEEGLREIDGIGDASITIIKEAMKKHGLDLPVAKTKRVVQFEKRSTINNSIKVSVDKWVPGPEEYIVTISEYAGHDMWIVQNWSYSLEGEPIILPPVFSSLEGAVQCAKELLREKENEE